MKQQCNSAASKKLIFAILALIEFTDDKSNNKVWQRWLPRDRGMVAWARKWRSIN